MYKIAITGTIGSGKSTMGRMLKEQNHNFLSADDLVKKAIAPNAPGYKPLLNLLGSQYLIPNSSHFDTQKIAKTVFASPDLLYQVESIIHPIVLTLMKDYEKNISGLRKKIIFYEIPLLFEKKLENLFDSQIVVAIDHKIQRERLIKFRRLSIEDIENRLQFQIPQVEKIKKAHYVIWNNSSIKNLEEEIKLYIKTKLKNF